MKGILTKNQAITMTSNEAREALEIIKTNWKFDAIITDLRMPGMSGQTFIAEIRKYEKENNLPPVPIIVLTGESDKREKLDCLTKYGANEYLLKPIKLNELMQAVSRLIAKDIKKFNRNILIVDDEDISADLMSKLLTSQGHKPTICSLLAEVKYIVYAFNRQKQQYQQIMKA
jgi:CheY-like chemotaxis protein